MSKTEEQDYEGIKWEEELEDKTLANVEQKLKNEFDVDFEDYDFDKKGFSKHGLPFYTGFSASIDYWNEGETEEVELFIERRGEMNTIEYWADDSSVMENFREFLTDHSRTTKGEMLEPYKIKKVADTQVLDLLASLEDQFTLEGPERNPGNGETRFYPVRMDHLETEHQGVNSKRLESEDGQYIFEMPENQDFTDDREYSGVKYFLPGDAKFQVKGELPEETEMDATLRVKPQTARKGIYKLELDADYEDRDSLKQLMHYTHRHLDVEQED